MRTRHVNLTLPVWGLFHIESSHLSKKITDFYPDSFVENYRVMIRIIFHNFCFTGVDSLSVWVVDEVISTWVVKKQEKWKRMRKYI